MSPKRPANNKSGNDRSVSGRSSSINEKAAATRRFEEIQLSRISGRLKEIGTTREIVRALGGDPERYTSQLAKQARHGQVVGFGAPGCSNLRIIATNYPVHSRYR